MSWVATAGGVILGPVVGSLLTRVVCDAVKPKDPSNTVLIGAAVYAASALASNEVADHLAEENTHAFAYGATWGNGIGAGLLVAGGLYLKTDSGKASLAQADRLANALNPGGASSSSSTPKTMTSGSSYAGGYCPAPRGLLALLTAAKAHGYT